MGAPQIIKLVCGFYTFFLWNSLYIFFNFQCLREKYETNVAGSSYCSILFYFDKNWKLKQSKNHDFDKCYLYVQKCMFFGPTSFIFQISYKYKKFGTVTRTISSNFCVILLFPEILEIKNKYTGFIKNPSKIHKRVLWFVRTV